MDSQEVLRQFAPALSRVVASYERDRHLRDDLLQDVLVAVVTALPRLTDLAKLKPFVFRISHNRCLSHVAKRMREPANVLALVEDLPSGAPSQEQALFEAERSDWLLNAVRDLALPYRQVMTLILEDLSYEDVAEILGLSVANVGIRVNRAKQQLKRLLHER